MRLRFKSVLVFIFIMIIACASIGVGYLFYNEVIDRSNVVVDGDLTINFINGDKFDNRLLLFDCLNSLMWLEKYPKYELYNDILFNKSKKLLR